MTDEMQKKILITDTTGALGEAIALACQSKNIPYFSCSQKEMNICDLREVREKLDELNPWAIINTANSSHMDMDLNVFGPTNLAMACRERKMALANFSFDHVFNESTDQSNVLSEERISAVYPQALVIRSAECEMTSECLPELAHAVLDYLCFT